MKEPVLVILAAGMGSRFGGLKQITPVDDSGHSIIDFSLFDAYRAGFRRVAFIIKHEIHCRQATHCPQVVKNPGAPAMPWPAAKA